MPAVFTMAMRCTPTISRYILLEMVPPFWINLGFFTFVFLMTRILDITNLVVNYKISLASVCWMLIYSMPNFLVFVIPMSNMMAVLLAFLRMSTDNEILALKAGGVSTYRLLPPVLVFCLLTGMATAFMTVYGMPWGNRAVREMTVRAAASNVDAGLKERTFNDSFEGVMLYINKIDMKSREMIDVFIEDQRTRDTVSTVMAPKGRLSRSPDPMAYILQLRDGIINQVNLKNRTVHSIHFDTYNIQLSLKKAMAKQKKKSRNRREMDIGELHEHLQSIDSPNRRYYAMLIEYHKKFSIPFACLALGVLAVPIGIQARSARRSLGLVLGLVFFLGYYLMLSAGIVFGEAGVYPPLVGMWVPNVVMGGLGGYLLVRSARERPVRMAFLANALRYVISKTRRWPESARNR